MGLQHLVLLTNCGYYSKNHPVAAYRGRLLLGTLFFFRLLCTNRNIMNSLHFYCFKECNACQATHKRTVCDWNYISRRHGIFPHPNHLVRCGKWPLPLLFEKYHVAMDKIIQFGAKNLTTTLTVERVGSWILH